MLQKKIGKNALDCLKHAILQILEKRFLQKLHGHFSGYEKVIFVLNSYTELQS